MVKPRPKVSFFILILITDYTVFMDSLRALLDSPLKLKTPNPQEKKKQKNQTRIKVNKKQVTVTKQKMTMIKKKSV